jgi:peptidoglycan/LPS O-acetylase OafA/YrhL
VTVSSLHARPRGRPRALDRSAEEAYRSRENLFDLLRLLSAFAVVFSHSFSLTGHGDPVNDATGLEAGTLGVLSLFALSGYLLAAGWESEQTEREYWAKRALRIMPALVVSAPIIAFALGPLVTDLSPGRYFGAGATYGYVAKQSLLDTFSSHLPGVFGHNPYATTVDGSLWTIPVEVCCYAALVLAVRLGALRRPSILLAVLGVVALAMVVGAPTDRPALRNIGTADELLVALRVCGAFASGVVLWVLRDRIPRTSALLALALALVVVPLPSGFHSAAAIVAVPYLVVVLGSAEPGRLRALTARGDVTYGVYVYSFPIQQTLAHALPGIAPAAMLALSFPLSWLVGLGSWRVVERPAISLRRRWGMRSAAAARELP